MHRLNPAYIVRRTLQAVVVIALTYTLVFFVLFILPGNPIEQQIFNPQNPLPEADAQILLAYYHLDRSGIEQFLIAVQRLFSGDLGYSLTNGQPVAELLRLAIPQTLALASTALVFAIVLALGIAILATFGPRRLRGFAESLPVIFLSTPSFLVGLMLLHLFSFQLGWVSSVRDEGFRSVVLPAIALAIAVSGPIAQVLIQGLRKEANQPFVLVLRAQGNSWSRIAYGHILKNGSIPAFTLLGMTAGELLAGSVITEVIFSRTGLGFLTQQAVREQDTPVILAVVILVSAVFVVVNLLIDLLYPLIDPRIEVTGTAPGRKRRSRAGLVSTAGVIDGKKGAAV